MNDTPNVREPALRRVLGLGPLLAVAIGLVVSQGVMVLMLQGAGTAGLGFIVPLGVAYLLALSYAFSFSELALMIPAPVALAATPRWPSGISRRSWRPFPATWWWRCSPSRRNCCCST